MCNRLRSIVRRVLLLFQDTDLKLRMYSPGRVLAHTSSLLLFSNQQNINTNPTSAMGHYSISRNLSRLIALCVDASETCDANRNCGKLPVQPLQVHTRTCTPVNMGAIRLCVHSFFRSGSTDSLPLLWPYRVVFHLCFGWPDETL